MSSTMDHPTSAATGTHSAPPNLTGQVAQEFVGQGRGFAKVRRRLRYVARFIYWTARHGSTKHAGWVCNYEGLYW